METLHTYARPTYPTLLVGMGAAGSKQAQHGRTHCVEWNDMTGVGERGWSCKPQDIPILTSYIMLSFSPPELMKTNETWYEHDYGLHGSGVRIRVGTRFFFSKTSRQSLGPTQPIQWVPGVLSREWRGRGVKLTIHLHLYAFLAWTVKSPLQTWITQYFSFQTKDKKMWSFEWYQIAYQNHWEGLFKFFG
jgi:hypothetical protein